MSDRRSWRGYIPLTLAPQAGPAGPPNSPKIDMVASTARGKIIDLITFERAIREISLFETHTRASM
jgi:hypothetical protein